MEFAEVLIFDAVMNSAFPAVAITGANLALVGVGLFTGAGLITAVVLGTYFLTKGERVKEGNKEGGNKEMNNPLKKNIKN
jgi:hypothetical protein